MRLLFVHQNFPGQYRHLAPALASSPENEVIGIGEEANIRRAQGFHPRVRLLAYPQPQGASAQTHHYLHSTEAAVRRGQAVVRLALALRAQGFVPDVICAHPGWGEALFLKDAFPSARLLLYLEFFYRGSGSDMGFDAEFPASLDDQCRARMRNATQLISLDAADACISPTHWQRDQYPAAFRERIHVIHDGVQTHLVCPAPVDEFLLPDGRGTLRSGDEVITYVARNLEPYRGFHTFMRALPAVLAARPKAQVLIVGGDEVSYGRRPANGECYREIYLREELGEAIDTRRVHFLGKVPYRVFLDVLRLSCAHVYLTYPFVLSWSLLEAMACACPLIASNTAPVREVVQTGRNGLLVDFFSPAALAERQIVSVLDKPQQMQPLRAQARRDIEERFDLERIALPRLICLVKELASATGNRTGVLPASEAIDLTHGE
jgi:glycosyltransferase involved in cell wall biosynthesis